MPAGFETVEDAGQVGGDRSGKTLAGLESTETGPAEPEQEKTAWVRVRWSRGRMDGAQRRQARLVPARRGKQSGAQSLHVRSPTRRATRDSTGGLEKKKG